MAENGRLPFSDLDVMILEDEFVIALDLEDLFQGWGCRNVRVAGTLRECEEMLANRPADILIADYNLGSDTSEQLIADLRAKNRFVILLTGQIIDEGMIDRMGKPVVVSKPIQPEALRERVERMARTESA